MKKIDIKIAPYLKRKKNIYSEYHIFADEASNYFKEPEKFAMYLGVAKRIGVNMAYSLLSEVKQSKAKTPEKLFMYKLRMYYVKIKPKKNVKNRKGRKK